ncbi:MAG: PEP-CTERM sorting domain-containing protein [Phycisphaerales bacterium]|nr:PEP-CTERM sorting domain-containing protein [Phycisphaerales bacterium]
MKTAAMILAAGIASSATAQDCVITVDPALGTVAIQYNGALPVQQLWSDISVRLTGDGAINILTQSSNYTDLLSPTGAVITGDGTNDVTFVGAAGGSLLGGTHSPDNPWAPFTFSYAGDVNNFGFELFNQNTNTFVQAPFGNPINMVNGDNSQGPMTYRVDIVVPAPASAALLGLGGLAAIRRRR